MIKSRSAYFWTSGKIKCLAHQTEPFVFLDQDMIIRNKTTRMGTVQTI